MKTNGTRKRKGDLKRKTPTGRHVRFSDDIVQWMIASAPQLGFNSDADLIRQAVREYKQRLEQTQSAAA